MNQAPPPPISCTFYFRRNRAGKLVILWGMMLLFFLPVASYTQTDSLSIDISKIRLAIPIQKKCWFAAQPKGSVPDTAIPSLHFERNKVVAFSRNFSPTLAEKDNYLRLSLYNNSDTVRKIFLLPAFYGINISLFKTHPGDPGRIIAVPPEECNAKTYSGAKLITLQPHEVSVWYCRFNLLRANINVFAPYLIETDYLQQWLSGIRNQNRTLDMVTYLASGIMLMMIFYSLAVYMQNRNKEFFYYAVYTFCTAVLLFLKSYMTISANAFNYIFEEYLDFMIMSASVFFYLIFVREFLNTRENHPRLDKLLRLARWPLLVLFCLYSAIYFFTNQYVILTYLENYVIKLFFLLVGVFFIVYGLRKNDTLLNYLAAGSFALVFFSIISQGIIMRWWEFSWAPGILSRAIFHYELGLVLELICFLSGLAYKNRRDLIERVKERERLKLENERKEFEKQMAVMQATQQERDRISTDMHDELGSGVTAIRLMSEILKTRMKDQTFPELEKISSSANDLLGKMNTIIWTMKSSNDTLESLVAYIRVHAIEYFDNTPIICSVQLPAVIPQVDISGEKRSNIFLSVKEALNNALKHSQASELRIKISAKDQELLIQVTDNGVGMDPEALRRFGNGLNNMRRRMESIGGLFKIDNREKGGTMICFVVPI